MSKTEADKVEKRGNRWCVVHCHGEQAGEIIKCFDTEAEALAMHRAIEAGKHSDTRDDPPFGDYEHFADCVTKNSGKGDPAAYCATIKRQILGDIAQRKVGFDKAQLDDKILLDDKDFLVMPAVIASEIVHEYPEGMAYKPGDELEKAAWTAEGRWVKILSHPDSALLQRVTDIYGKIENVKFAKDLLEPKTKRPMRRGIKADIKWFKNRVPEDVITKIREGTLRDVSIGFTYEEDKTPGEWNGQKYDYVQRNIFIDHVAAPIEAGRCPGPVCGIAVDSVIQNDKECPVCISMRQVGYTVAGSRLYKHYGPDVLEVIEGHPLLQIKQDDEDLITKSRRIFKELNERLQT